MHNRIFGVVMLSLGLTSLARALGNQRIAALHGSDIVLLIACGACLGVAIVALLGRVKLRSTP